jgi:SAM-dependent methyltransferase
MIAAEQENPMKEVWGPQALEETRKARREFQDRIAAHREDWIHSNKYFYDGLKRMLQFIVEPGKRVLEVRCETGEFLAAVMPAYGVGAEIGEAMTEHARRRHPELHFVKSDPEELDLHEKFDYILFNHIFDTVDVLRAFERVRRHCTSETQVIVINYNHLWQPILQFASKIGLRSKFVEPNWISENDIRGFLRLAGFRPVRKHRLMLFPKWLPLVSFLVNKVLARLPALRRLCLMQVMVARPLTEPQDERDVTVSVIVPCRNERGD